MALVEQLLADGGDEALGDAVLPRAPVTRPGWLHLHRPQRRRRSRVGWTSAFLSGLAPDVPDAREDVEWRDTALEQALRVRSAEPGCAHQSATVHQSASAVGRAARRFRM